MSTSQRFYASRILILFALSVTVLLFARCSAYDVSQKEVRPHIKSRNYNPLLEDNLDAEIEDLSSQIAGRVNMSSKGTVAVVDFVDLSGRNVNDLCRYIPNGLIDRLFRTGKFQLLERKLLPKIMEELKLNFNDLFDPKSAKRMGRLLGADALLSGTISDMGKSIKVNARLIQTETGRILAVAEADIAKGDKVKRLTGAGIVVLSPPPPPSTPPENEKPKEGPKEEPKDRNRRTPRLKGNLIVNGDFEEQWTVGWERMVGDPSRGANHVKIVYSADGEGDDDLYLYHSGKSYMTLYQCVQVVSSNLLFSASFKLGPVTRRNATSMIELQYGDRKGRHIGSTRLINYDYRPFIYERRRGPLNTGFVHHIKMKTRWYRNYTINLRKEIINNLPAIDPDRIRDIIVILYVGGDYKHCVSKLYADNIKLWYR